MLRIGLCGFPLPPVGVEEAGLMLCGYCGERPAELIDAHGVRACKYCDDLGRDPVALARELLIAEYMLDRMSGATWNVN